jgi:hypothetical protein
MYQQATLSCPHTGSSTATGYVPAGYPVSPVAQAQLYYVSSHRCPHGRSSTATGYVPAGYLESHGRQHQQQAMYRQATLSCPTRSLKHSSMYQQELFTRNACNRTKQTSRLPDCPTRSSTATGYVPAGYLELPSHRSLKHSNRLCARRLPWSASRRSLNQQQVYKIQRTILSLHHTPYQVNNRLCTSTHWVAHTATGMYPGTLSCLPHGRSNTATDVPAGTLSCLHRSPSTATGYAPALPGAAPHRSLTQQQATKIQQATRAVSHGSLATATYV